MPLSPAPEDHDAASRPPPHAPTPGPRVAEVTLVGWWSVLNDGQLLVAGLALMLAAEQAVVWRWEGPRSRARLVTATAVVTALTLVTNRAVLVDDGGRYFGALMFLRTLTLAALGMCTLVLAANLVGAPAPRKLAVALVAVLLGRLALWPTTDLIYAHRLHDGVPVYGPLTAPTGLAAIVLLFGYLLLSARRGRDDGERVLLTLGVLGSLLLAVASFLAANPAVAELLTGYLSLPALAALSLLVWTRQNHAHRRVLELAGREHALARLGQLALTEPLPQVIDAAARTARQHVRGEINDEDREFLAALSSVVTATASRERSTHELRHRANHDALTGLPNRSYVHQIVDEALADCDTPRRSVAVALCDLDRFKAVNDVHGHRAGDEVLSAVARRLMRICRECDRVGRFGGDEFAVVCSDAYGADSVQQLTDRILRAFIRPVSTPDVQAHVTASVGVAVADGTHAAINADNLLRDAGTALHDAKQRGGATIGHFNDNLRSAVVRRADLERRLTEGLRRGEIHVHYQPVVDVATRTVVGFEALARWQCGTDLIQPADWIPIVETTDLIHAVGEQVLSQASAQLQEWRRAGWLLHMSVNVAARQLANPQFLLTVRRAVPRDLPAGAVIVEVTESTAVDDQAVEVLAALRTEGVRIALDDFGTGYSALSAVARLPIDIIKIDQTITRRVAQGDGHALVSATLAIASSLGLEVVAEGIETEDQHRRLRALGCRLGQGYLYSAPLTPADATRLLESTLPRGMVRKEQV